MLTAVDMERCQSSLQNSRDHTGAEGLSIGSKCSLFIQMGFALSLMGIMDGLNQPDNLVE